ncbi:MAG: rhomboid family intramembrane serine protease [Gemmatales bacterium]
MREMATLTDAHDARVLVDYLLTQKIVAEIRPEDGKPVVWIHNEDDMERAVAIWNEFKTQPHDSKYVAAQKPAEELRKLKKQVERNYARLYKDGTHLWGRPHPFGVPVTMTLIILSIIVTLWTEFGSNRPNLMALTFMDHPQIPLMNLNEVNPDVVRKLQHNVREQQLASLKKGEVWRLITPIFLHFTWLHLIFNMYALYSLGGLIESRRGPLWLILFVVITGIYSNAMQFYFPTMFNLHSAKEQFIGASIFGGMSGVAFALFGYLVAKTMYAPEPGLHLPQDTIISMLIWLAVCMTGMIGSIANTAHVAGLLAGFVIGVMPKVWKLFRQRF